MTRIDLSGVDLDAVAVAQAAARLVEAWKPPIVMPPQWTIDERYEDGMRYVARGLRLAAVLSCCVEADDRAWLHLSVSHRDRVPTWYELVTVKELLLGDREAYKILPPRDRYVNIHPNVLHLFALLDDKATALPDFTHGMRSL